jgi:hypothetical protein
MEMSVPKLSKFLDSNFYLIKKRKKNPIMSQAGGRTPQAGLCFPVASSKIMSPCLWKLIH